jgi:hypothetical protein
VKLLRQVGPHPFLASAYPSLALLAANIGQVRPSIVFRPLGLSLLVGLLLVGVLRWWLKDWARAGLLATGWLVLFFGYGPVYQALKAISIGGATIGRHRFLVPTWLVLAVAGAWLVAGRRIVVPAWSRLLSTALGVAVLLPLGQLVWSALSAAAASNSEPSDFSVQIEARAGRPESLPDIYYIILDAYARADTLRQAFGLDNSEFLDGLRSLGFYVAECSQSNYSQTELSLGSSLNMAYLEDLDEEPLVQETDRQRLWPLLRHSLVRGTFERLGYTTVAFETGYYWTEWEDADIYLAPGSGWLSGMTAFEATLLRSTAAWAAIDAAPVLPAGLLRDMDRSTAAHRSRVQFVLDELSRMAERPGPKFVFVHLVSPHRPFVFDAQGNPVEDEYTWTRSQMGLEAYTRGYREQVQYLNSRILPILSRLIADSDPAPVIILQGDHGPEEGSSEERMRILNVYYLGDTGQDELYPTITPVNSFRLALVARLGLELPLLEDVSYFSTYDRPFDYSIVEASCDSGG